MTDDDRWQALCARDPRFDEHFVFAVRSTGIYCRPSCPARRPRREHTLFYADAQAARQAGYRPCRRCAPDGMSPARQLDALVQAACRLLDAAEAPLPLAQLAARIGLSPSHLARAFKARTGVTPRAWAEGRRRARLEAALPEADSVLDAALAAGYSGTRALYQQPAALSAGRRRARGAGERLAYAIAACPLGRVLLAASARGVCAVLFGDDEASLVAQLQQRFTLAELQRDDDGLHAQLAALLAQLEEPARAAELPLDLRGSAFQLRVWQALRQIPPGTTRRYAELAAHLGSHPRAVARACASNPLGLLVPCHRVIAGDGSLAGYRWGVARKAALLAAEAAEAAHGAQGDGARRAWSDTATAQESAMPELKRYLVSYLLHEQPHALQMEGFAPPSLDEARVRILHQHLAEPRVMSDAPWENPLFGSEHSRIAELGVTDIRIEPLP